MRGGTTYDTLATTLEKGDRLLFVSDGIPEAQTVAGDSLGYDGLLRIIPTTDAGDLSEWLDRFLDLVRAEVVTVLSDDWTAVVLERG
jgi:serine phosphatase RsbU (regulator of sigma subunit)